MCTGGFCLPPGSAPADGPSPDDGAPSDGPDVCTTFASQLDTCAVAASGALNLDGNHTYNTNTHELKKAGTVIPTTHVEIEGLAGPIELLVVTDFTLVTGNLRVTGDVPFGIVASGMININGTLDASDGGAGARGPSECGDAAGKPGTSSIEGSSGGGGGALRGGGGGGGKGDANQNPIDGAPGGVAIALPSGPLGGCPGGKGGGDAATLGAPGDGGGAIYLVAGSAINITGTVHAGGGGALHAHAISGGGGGGGSGGMIVIEAPMVTVTGTLAANGGGGSGGADDVAGSEGQDGERARASATRAKGGAGAPNSEGGDGGDGGAGGVLAGSPSTEAADNGGGGGGGGCGFIAIGSPMKLTIAATISPDLSAWPDPP